MTNKFRIIPCCLAFAVSCVAAVPTAELALTGTVERYIAIDNVCAWPNLTMMPDGRITAAIFNRPSHGEEEGSLEVWGSPDGRFWEKRGVAAPHDPQTNRMHVAIGLAKNGDLLAIVSGFTNIQQTGRPKQPPFRDKVIPAWVCRSSDGGRTWTQHKAFTPAFPGWNTFVPYGEITLGGDGALHATCYTRKLDSNPGVQHVWHFRSDDDGRTWRPTSIIGTNHNETDLFHLGGLKWLAAARTLDTRTLDLFRSNDDGATWEGPQRVTENQQMPADLERLSDGRLLMSYGTRIEGGFGVLAKLSHDEGRTWSAPIRLADSLHWDCGYPSSVQRPDGRVVTAYYSKSAQNHNRYHMGVVIWNPPAPGQEK